MSWLNAPALPYDFCELREGHNLRGLMVTFSEGATAGQVVQPLITATKEIVDEIISKDLQLPMTNIVDPNSSEFDVAELNRLLNLYSRLQSHLSVLQSIYNPQPTFQGRVNAPFTGTFNLQGNIDLLHSLGTVLRYVPLSVFLTSLLTFMCRDVYWRGNKLLRSVPKKYSDALRLDIYDANGRKRQEKPEIADEDFIKKYGFPRREPAFRNIEMLQYFASFLTRKILKFFAGLSNSIVTRSTMGDLNQRSMAVAVVNAIADVFSALLTYEETRGEQTIDVHLYWFCCANFIYTVLNGGNLPHFPPFGGCKLTFCR